MRHPPAVFATGYGYGDGYSIRPTPPRLVRFKDHGMRSALLSRKQCRTSEAVSGQKLVSLKPAVCDARTAEMTPAQLDSGA
jgi:hypothetical protein